MYVLDLYFENARANGDGHFGIAQTRGEIPKWTVLGSNRQTRELMRLLALACAGASYIHRLSSRIRVLFRKPKMPLILELVVARHMPRDGISGGSSVVGSGLRIHTDGSAETMTRTSVCNIPADMHVYRPVRGTRDAAYLFVGYGPKLVPRQQEDFEFLDPLYRVSRFESLFKPRVSVTDPVAFLTRLQDKAVFKSRYPAQQTLQRLSVLLAKYLDIQTGTWRSKLFDPQEEWSKLTGWQRCMALPIIDCIRHMIDASPHIGQPLLVPGLLLLDRPDQFCPIERLGSWLKLVDAIFPKMQSIVTLSGDSRRRFPTSLRSTQLPMPDPPTPKEEKHTPKLGSKNVLLIDVDGRFPNLALMKISTHLKSRRHPVNLIKKEIYVKNIGAVWASCVFHNSISQRRIDRLRRHYGDALTVGGSGVDIKARLPRNVENAIPDFDLYPELEDRGIGFLTRGCSFKCPFCIVPIKEGKPHQVADLDILLQGRKKLILLDDNLLAHSAATGLLEEMVQKNIAVNFNQTLDICLLNDETTELLRQVRAMNVRFTRRNYHFSLNNTSRLAHIRRQYDKLGFSPRDNVEFICMYGFNTTLAQDVARFRFLRSLPGVYVFVQLYQPFLGGPNPITKDFFDNDADRHIDELVRIVFTQNMKSMEKYYKWLSRCYVRQFGQLHRGLVDTIFRYNNREAKGRYIASLAGTKPKASQH